MSDSTPLPVTERTRHRRLREQGSTDRKDPKPDPVLPAGITLPPHIAAFAHRPAGILPVS